MTGKKLFHVGLFDHLRHCLPLLLLLALMLPTLASAAELIVGQRFEGSSAIVLDLASPLDPAVLADPGHYTVHAESDPDIKLAVDRVQVAADKRSVTLGFAEPLNTTKTFVVTARELSPGVIARCSVAKPYLGYLFSILLSALLVNNFVFTKYLGLCVFFGTSKKKSTAKGMGVVFTLVMVVSASMSWVFHRFILVPFHLDFLQIVVFIGLVSLTVQAVDTILRKVNPILFQSFGVFLVLVIANCVIIAVPLLMASNDYSYPETFMLSLGAGGGFLLALYLMSSVRERLDLANIPPSFRGLPIAFIVAGQFAMAFLGFSGLQIF
nr:Rnf-Nqr domain containing protein [uncultured Desulfobulbus sp.]